ncbi:hypothetical protein T11_1327, partial [Trichinella zimbabwensis]
VLEGRVGGRNIKAGRLGTFRTTRSNGRVADESKCLVMFDRIAATKRTSRRFICRSLDILRIETPTGSFGRTRNATTPRKLTDTLASVFHHLFFIGAGNRVYVRYEECNRLDPIQQFREASTSQCIFHNTRSPVELRRTAGTLTAVEIQDAQIQYVEATACSKEPSLRIRELLVLSQFLNEDGILSGLFEKLLRASCILHNKRSPVNLRRTAGVLIAVEIQDAQIQYVEATACSKEPSLRIRELLVLSQFLNEDGIL